MRPVPWKRDRVSHRRRCRPNVFDSGLRDRHGTGVPGPGYSGATAGLATRAETMAGPYSPGTGKVSHPAGPIVASARGAVPSALARLGIHTIFWPFGQHSCVFGCGRHSCVRQLRRRSSRIVVSWMLTERQLAVLRASPPTRRVATAISLAGVTQVTVAEEIGVTQTLRQRCRPRPVLDDHHCKRAEVHPVLRLLHRRPLSTS